MWIQSFTLFGNEIDSPIRLLSDAINATTDTAVECRRIALNPYFYFSPLFRRQIPNYKCLVRLKYGLIV